MSNLIESTLIERTVIKITQEQAREIGAGLRALINVTMEIEKEYGKQILVFEIKENL